MPTPIFICGAECGITAVGTAGVGVEHWTTQGGTSPTVVTSGPAPMRSARAFRFNPSAALCNFTHTFATAIASPATIVGRFYVYFTTLPSADTRLFSDTIHSLVFKQSDSTLRAGGVAVTDQAAGGIAITTGRVYRIDIKGVRNTTTTTDLSVDGVAQTQYSVAGAAGTLATITLGIVNSCSADFYMDDIIFSGSTGDFPIGEGTVVGLYPNADGSHTYSATTDFLDGGNAGTALAAAVSEVDTWQSLQTVLSTSIDTARFITNQTGIGTEFLEWQFSNTPVDVLSVNGVMVVSTQHSATATANLSTLQVNDNGTINAVYTDADFSEVTIVVATKTYAVAPSTSSAWTKTLVDGLRARWVGSADVAPDPILDGICYEVDYVPAAHSAPHIIVAPSIAVISRASRW